MNLGFNFRRGINTLPDVLDAMVARINAVWKKQHKDDGSHGSITASSLDVTGNTFTGPIQIEGPLSNLPPLPDGSGRWALELGQGAPFSPPTPANRIMSRKARPIPTTAGADFADLDIAARSVRFTNGIGGQVFVNQSSGAITCTPELISIVAGIFNGIIQANGGQIQFPAVQLPSANANTLDDYEEGLWTPALRFGGASVGLTYTSQSGNYVKVGRRVFWQFYIILSAVGSSAGAASIAGFPFAMENMFPLGGGYTTFTVGMSGLLSMPSAFMNNNATTVDLVHCGPAGAGSLTNTNFTATAQLAMCGMYQTTN